ncbi:unnamed protein product [Rotaria socialis]
MIPAQSQQEQKQQRIQQTQNLRIRVPTGPIPMDPKKVVKSSTAPNLPTSNSLNVTSSLKPTDSGEACKLPYKVGSFSWDMYFCNRGYCPTENNSNSTCKPGKFSSLLLNNNIERSFQLKTESGGIDSVDQQCLIYYYYMSSMAGTKIITVTTEETSGTKKTIDSVTNSPFNGWIQRKILFKAETRGYKLYFEAQRTSGFQIPTVGFDEISIHEGSCDDQQITSDPTAVTSVPIQTTTTTTPAETTTTTTTPAEMSTTTTTPAETTTTITTPAENTTTTTTPAETTTTTTTPAETTTTTTTPAETTTTTTTPAETTTTTATPAETTTTTATPAETTTTTTTPAETTTTTTTPAETTTTTTTTTTTRVLVETTTTTKIPEPVQTSVTETTTATLTSLIEITGLNTAEGLTATAVTMHGTVNGAGTGSGDWSRTQTIILATVIPVVFIVLIVLIIIIMWFRKSSLKSCFAGNSHPSYPIKPDLLLETPIEMNQVTHV